MNNHQVAAVLRQIGDMLEIQGENRFRILGYRNGADAIEGLAQDIQAVWEAGDLRTISGIGDALALKIDELLRTGKLSYQNKLALKTPPGVTELLHIPDVGPAKARIMWEQLGIDGVAAAEEAARSGRLAELPGFGTKTVSKLLAGIESLRKRQAGGRSPLGQALPLARQLQAYLLANAPGIHQIAVAGSLRRWRDTIGDIDLLVTTEDAKPVMDAFRSYPRVAEVLLSGATKTSVRLDTALQIDLRVVDASQFGTALQYFTGSQSHNVALRELALKRGWSLNE
jgi:DNA polymerase (family 10)